MKKTTICSLLWLFGMIVGVAQAQTGNSGRQQGSSPVLIKDLKAYGDPLTGQLSFKATISRSAKSANAITLSVKHVVDDKGNTIPSYLNCDKNTKNWYPIIADVPTSITIQGEESVIVQPDVMMLRQVVLCGSNGDRWPEKLATFINVPIEWEPLKESAACWPAEHYLSRRNVFEGTPVAEHKGFIETGKEETDDGEMHALNHGDFIRLAGVVGNTRTGEVRIIIKFKGKMRSSGTKFFDEDGNLYEQRSNVFFPQGEPSEAECLTELVSIPFKVPVTVKHLQKLTIDRWSFSNITIQWIEF